MAADWVQRFKISAKDATTVTLVPVVDGDSSLLDTGRVISQIVITSTGLADHTTEKFFSEVNRVFKLEVEKK
ncbi:MAG: hypothetical protein ACM35H_14185 [Bacteroidota bacterium]